MEMRRKDRALSEEETKALLKGGEYGILSTIGPDGYPYGVPISYAYDEEQGLIFMHCAKEVGHKYENILFLPKACLTVVGNTKVLPEKFSTKYESVIAIGTVELPEDKLPALMALVKKYCPGLEEKGLIYAQKAQDTVTILALHIEELTGKARK